MNKETLNITKLVTGILTAVLGLFMLISSIILLTDVIKHYSGNLLIYGIIVLVVNLATVVGLGYFGYLLIKSYLNKKEENKKVLMPLVIVFLSTILTTIVGMIFLGFNALLITQLVFVIAALIVACLVLFGEFNDKIQSILALVVTGIAFVLAILALANTSGLGIAINLFYLFVAIATMTYFIFRLILLSIAPAKTENDELKDENN